MHDGRQGDTIASLEARLLRVERTNRNLSWLAATATIVIIIAGAMPSAQVPDKIEARQFVLLSPEGKVIAELGADPIEDEPYFHLFDKKGDLRLAVYLGGLTICEKFADRRVTTTGRVSLTRLADGESSFLFRDDQGRSRLQLGITKGGAPALEMWDGELTSRIKMTLDPKSNAPIVSIDGVPVKP